MDAVGSEARAWLDRLLALPNNIATKVAGMDATAWAAWVQAVGSVLAIGAGFLTMYLQNRRADNALRAERRSRAEVVALRLSGSARLGGAWIRAFSACDKNGSCGRPLMRS
jgi:hypothetical protein